MSLKFGLSYQDNQV